MATLTRITVGLGPGGFALDPFRVVHGLLTASSGYGKSTALRKVLEESYGRLPQLVLDYEGEFGTLREVGDYVLIGPNGDLPADVRAARLLPRKAMEARFDAIVDLSELTVPERHAYVRDAALGFMDLPRELWGDILIVLDEAHHFIPESGKVKEVSVARDALVDLISRGRKRGFRLLMATQRLAKLQKDAAAECNVKLCGYQNLDDDRKRAIDELGLQSARQEYTKVIMELKPGEFLAAGGAFPHAGTLRAKFDLPKTAPPPRGKGKVSPPQPREAVLRVLESLRDLPQQAQAEIRNLAEAKHEVTRLRREVTVLKRQQPAPRVETKLVTKTEVKRVEVPVLTKEERSLLERVATVAKRDGEILAKRWEQVDSVAKRVMAAASAKPLQMPPTPRLTVYPAPNPEKWTPKPEPGAFRRMVDAAPPSADGAFRPSSSQQRVLDALAWLESVRVPQAKKTQLALMSRQSPTSSGYTNNLGALRTAGLLDYPAPGFVHLTDAGRAQARAPDEPPTTEALHVSLYRRLSGSQAAILKALIEAYPEDVDKVQLAETAGQSVTSSGYTNNLGALRSLGLVDYPKPGRAVALPVLFLEEQVNP